MQQRATFSVSVQRAHTSIFVSFMILSLALACLSLHSLGSESQHLGEEQEHGRSTYTMMALRRKQYVSALRTVKSLSAL